MKGLVAVVHSYSERGQWNLFTVSCLAEREGLFADFAAAELRKKWRELAQGGFKHVVRLVTAYKRQMKERASDLTLVESGIRMCRALPDSVTMSSAVKDLSRLVELEGTEALEKLKAQKKRSCPEWAEPWKPMFGDRAKLLALLDVAVAIECSESGFLSLSDAAVLFEEAHAESGGEGAPNGFKASCLNTSPS
jgi:hypothetical protein